jgi:hypothetical protein
MAGDASRANARRSTGPRTSAGKARSAQNARRHGLSRRRTPEELFSPAIIGFARALCAGFALRGPDDPRWRQALEIARAEAFLDEVRAARQQALDDADAWAVFGVEVHHVVQEEHTAMMAAVATGERMALHQQALALRISKALRTLPSDQGPAAHIILAAPELERLDRFAAEGHARLRRAIAAFDQAKAQDTTSATQDKTSVVGGWGPWGATAPRTSAGPGRDLPRSRAGGRGS